MNSSHSVHIATVIDNVDVENRGRVRIRLPASSGAVADAWARLATFMAGANRGSWFVPEVNDEVVVAFEGGDVRLPVVLGSVWSAGQPPPATALPGNDAKLLRSRSGLAVSLDDTAGRERITLSTPGGQTIALHDGPGSITIADQNGNVVELSAQGVTVASSATVTVRASVVEVRADIVEVTATLSKFSGIVQCDKLVSESVVAQSYAPGAGNIW